tara:strand:+ start:37 stop:372 length:336 start_codon:yes stop_codon:yes gene_type:complete
MTPEAKVKKVVVRQLKEINAYYFYPVTGGYGRSGVPDIVGCYNGRFFGIECKAGKNKPTPLQQRNLDDIAMSRGAALVVNEENMLDVKDWLISKTLDPQQLELSFGGTQNG